MRVALLLIAGVALVACQATNRPLATPANPTLAPGAQASNKPASPVPSGSSAPSASPSPKALGFRDVEGPAQGKLGEAVVLEGNMLVPNACAGPSKLSLTVDEAKREVRMEAFQQLSPTPAPGEEGPICTAVVSEVPASASFTPQSSGSYLVRVGMGFDRKAEGFRVNILAADAEASSPVPRVTPGPLPSAS